MGGVRGMHVVTQGSGCKGWLGVLPTRDTSYVSGWTVYLTMRHTIVSDYRVSFVS
jgi:hypothetical protein